MKKIKLITSLVGLGLSSAIIGVTVVSCSSDKNQTQGKVVEDDKPNNPSEDPNSGTPGGSEGVKPPADSESKPIDWHSLFRDKQTLRGSGTMSPRQAINEIRNSVDKLWTFYSKPNNLPSAIIEINVITANDTSISVQLKINNTIIIAFLISGFISENSNNYIDYETAISNFENLNKNATAAKGGLFVLGDNLTTAPTYFMPKIPTDFASKSINVRLTSVASNYNGSTKYTYALSLPNGRIVNSIVNVSGFYKFPIPAINDDKENLFKLHRNDELIKDKNWVPSNDALLKNSNNISSLANKAEFNKFISEHWNASLAADAVNAMRRIYGNNTGSLTTNLKQYIQSSYINYKPNKFNMSYLMVDANAPTLITSNTRNWEKFNILINPEYDSWITSTATSIKLNLTWKIKQLDVLGTYGISYSGSLNKYKSDVTGVASIEIPTTTKPTLKNNVAQFSSLPVLGQVETTSDIGKDSKVATLNILDALYYFYNPQNLQTETNKWLNNANDYGTNLYAIFTTAFRNFTQHKGA